MIRGADDLALQWRLVGGQRGHECIVIVTLGAQVMVVGSHKFSVGEKELMLIKVRNDLAREAKNLILPRLGARSAAAETVSRCHWHSPAFE